MKSLPRLSIALSPPRLYFFPNLLYRSLAFERGATIIGLDRRSRLLANRRFN